MRRLGHDRRQTARGVTCVALALVLAGPPALGREIVNSGDIVGRLDTSIRLTTAWRLSDPNAMLIADPNGDDGDRNFQSGPISQRADLLAELGFTFGSWGVEVSGAAWYDAVYNRRTDHNSPATFSAVSVPFGKFPAATRKLHGEDAELLNAHVHANFDIGDAPVTVRVGRQTLLWGETVFFAENGIAAGMAPIDTIKATSVPGSRASEVFMPAAQAWISARPWAGVSFEAFYQFEWRKSRLLGAGSYFSPTDFLGVGGERLVFAANEFFSRSADEGAPDSGQFGAAVRITGDSADFGFYALTYHAHDPVVYLRLGPLNNLRSSSAGERERTSAYGVNPTVLIGGPGNPLRDFVRFYGDPATGEVGKFSQVYARGIEIYGASANGYAGDHAVAGEISLRRGMPLASGPLSVLPSVYADNHHAPLYPTGNTLHGQIVMTSVMGPSDLWDGAAFAAELGANSLLDLDLNAARYDSTRTRSALSMRGYFEAQYFAVLPGLDVSVPISVGYNVAGRSSVIQSQTEGAGNFEIGLAATYRAVWTASVKLTSYFGSPEKQAFADRDFVSISVARTF